MQILNGKVEKIDVVRNYLCIVVSTIRPGTLVETRFNIFNTALKRKCRKLEGCEVSMFIIKLLWYFPLHLSHQFEICCLTSMHFKFNILLLLLQFQILSTQIYFCHIVFYRVCCWQLINTSGWGILWGGWPIQESATNRACWNICVH